MAQYLVKVVERYFQVRWYEVEADNQEDAETAPREGVLRNEGELTAEGEWEVLDTEEIKG